MNMNTIFVILAKGQEVRNFLYGDLSRLAKDRPDVRLIVFLPKEKADKYRSQFEHERCLLIAMPAINLDWRLKKLFRIACFGCIPTSTIWSRIWFSYLNGGSVFNLAGKLFFWMLGHFRAWRAIMRWAEYHLFRDDRIWNEYFERYAPDVVFGGGLLNEEDFLAIKYAKRRGIPTAGITCSWDNFTSKGFLRVHPDILFLQNESMVKEAIALNSFPRARIRVVGFPQWDHYFDPSWHMTKEEFGKKFGIDPTKRWVTYFGGGLLKGLFGLPENGDHVVMLNRAIERGEIQNACTIIRAHPGHIADLSEEAKKSPLLNFGKGWEFNADDMRLLLNLVRLSDVTLNFGSTMALEAALFDKPIVLMTFTGFAGDSSAPWHKRPDTAFRYTLHYKEVIATGGLWRVENEQELVHAVKSYLDNPLLHHEGRKKIVSEFVGPHDGNAGKRIFDILLSLAEKKGQKTPVDASQL